MGKPVEKSVDLSFVRASNISHEVKKLSDGRWVAAIDVLPHQTTTKLFSGETAEAEAKQWINSQMSLNNLPEPYATNNNR